MLQSITFHGQTLRLPSSLPSHVGMAVAALAIAGLSSQVATTSSRAAASPELFPLPASPPVPAKEDAPKGGQFELTLHVAEGSDVADLLRNAGASLGDAELLAKKLTNASNVGESDIRLSLGNAVAGGRRIVRVIHLTELGTETFVRSGNDFVRTERSALTRQNLVAGPDLYWDARRASLNADDANRLLQLSKAMDPGTAMTVVIGAREGRFGGHQQPALLYAEGRASSGKRERGVRLDSGQWLALGHPAPSAMVRPVPGLVTSTFGVRWHPILQFLRPHRGVDFAAAYGQPVLAAADGMVEAAGWHGGYGRQVRIAHSRVDESSYSHLSSLAVSPGEHVRRGQLIGYAGASGLATGPHLHFEVYRHGVAVDPLGSALSASDNPLARDDVQARLRQLGVSLS